MKTLFLAAAAATAMAAAPAAADVVTLTFEGIANNAPVGNFYAPDYIFSDSALALVDGDAGGDGNFANEPSPNTVMFFHNADNAVLNVPNGFATGFSFFYSSLVGAEINVYSGLDATGDLLATLPLSAQFNLSCTGDPTGDYCNWSPSGVEFDGVAHSIDFGGTANQTAYDNITFGAKTPGDGDNGDPVTPGVPEPASWALLIAGFGLMGTALRRRRGLTTA